MTSQATIFVRGRVQGVFFRDWAKIEATKRNLSGWVRNENDYNLVTVCVQGPRGQIEEFIGICRTGPVSARVDAVDVTWAEKPSAPFGTFEIRY